MLEIKNLNVSVSNKEILKDINLNININEVHAIMGPNGIGKSTICKTIMGDPNYHVNKGKITFNGEDLLRMSVDERSKKGIFLLSQAPIEVPGVTNAEMLRIALTEKTGKNISIFDFNKKMETICAKLQIPKSFIHRGINEGMSGGEKKKNELLHLWMLEPKLVILDELDSGLDVDSLKVVCESLNEYKQTHEVSYLIISHHLEVLKLLNADHVHVIYDGKIVNSKDISLAEKIEKEGFSKYIKANDISKSDEDE